MSSKVDSPEKLKIETTLKTYNADTGELFEKDETKDIDGVIRLEFFSIDKGESATKCSVVGTINTMAAAESMFSVFEQIQGGIECLSIVAERRAKTKRGGGR